MTLKPLNKIEDFCLKLFDLIGADENVASACVASVMHGTRFGVDSHGVRLIPHYIKVLETGRLNKNPSIKFENLKLGSGLLDGDHSQGALPTYKAMDHAIEMAKITGIAAVGIMNSSHFGPAGAYTLHAAKKNMIALAFCNSDSFVRLHGGAERFHGTNPISMAVPTGELDPWLFDMATSSVPFNRVELFRSLDLNLPQDVASDKIGNSTQDPHVAEMLDPLGARFGFKGAGLGGISEIFSAVLTGMKLSPELLPMSGSDMTTPRELGAFVIAIDPEGFIGSFLFKEGMQKYLSLLRNSAVKEKFFVMAPGDREWQTARKRDKNGVVLDPVTIEQFKLLADRFGITSKFNFGSDHD
ncbi:MAG: Ldh family oxidoreductase [Paracoccaceae bacterium]|nr:Ldh family oxidoreductase [Paracoccaceae bacterium]